MIQAILMGIPAQTNTFSLLGLTPVAMDGRVLVQKIYCLKELRAYG
jgi:hypothetical protein